MYVDKTHSKKDIVTLFKKHGVIINSDLTKSKIISQIENYIDDFIYDDKIKNLTELKLYLKNKSTKQRPNQIEKSQIMFSARKIIKWSKNKYIFDGKTYNNADDIFNDIMKIYKWGDFPSIRKACRLYNASPYCINHVNPIMSEYIEEQINNNRILKEQIIYCLTIKHSKEGESFKVCFD